MLRAVEKSMAAVVWCMGRSSRDLGSPSVFGWRTQSTSRRGVAACCPVCIRCDVVYFNLVCAVSSRILLYAHGPGGESRDVDDDKQQLLSDARPFEVAAENRQRGIHMGYLPMWRVWRH